MTVMLHRLNILGKNEQMWARKLSDTLWWLLCPFAAKGYKRTCHESSYPCPQKTIKLLWNEPKPCFQKQRSLILKSFLGALPDLKRVSLGDRKALLPRDTTLSFPSLQRLNLNPARPDSLLSHPALCLWWQAATSNGKDSAPSLRACARLQDETLGARWCEVQRSCLLSQDYILLLLLPGPVVFCGNSHVWKKEKNPRPGGREIFFGDGGLSGLVFCF